MDLHIAHSNIHRQAVGCKFGDIIVELHDFGSFIYSG